MSHFDVTWSLGVLARRCEIDTEPCNAAYNVGVLDGGPDVVYVEFKKCPGSLLLKLPCPMWPLRCPHGTCQF